MNYAGPGELKFQLRMCELAVKENEIVQVWGGGRLESSRERADKIYKLVGRDQLSLFSGNRLKISAVV
jgi:hypothetical protein